MLANARTRKGQRRGTLTLEALLLLPVVLLILLGMMQIGLMFSAKETLSLASREGARVLARGGSETDAQEAVALVLGTGSLSTATVTIDITNDDGSTAGSGDPVTVTVSIASSTAVPNFVAFFKINLQESDLSATTVMRKE